MIEQFDRDKWCKEHPIRSMVISMANQETEKEEEKEFIEQQSFADMKEGDENGAI